MPWRNLRIRENVEAFNGTLRIEGSEQRCWRSRIGDQLFVPFIEDNAQWLLANQKS